MSVSAKTPHYLIITSALFALMIVFSVGNAYAEEYDLSDHPVYNWEYNPDANFSNERYSSPKSSNDYTLAYLLSVLQVEFDPTHRYYQPPVPVAWDYCQSPQFSNFHRCR